MRTPSKAHFWTPEEDAYLLEHYYSKPKQFFAEKFGVTENAVYHRRKSIMLGKKARVYSDDMILFLIENWEKMNAKEMATKLGTSVNSIYVKAWSLRKKGIYLRLKTDENGTLGLPIGTISGKRIKRADGTWGYHRVAVKKQRVYEKKEPVVKEKKERPVKQPKPPKVKQPKLPKVKAQPIKVPPRREPKPKPIKMKQREVDYSQGTWVRIDHKTLKFVKSQKIAS